MIRVTNQAQGDPGNAFNYCAIGVPHWPGELLPQVSPPVQVPQLGMRLPQPSPAGPQLMFSWAHVWGTHEPPSFGQVPQPFGMRLPQPSPAGPHVMFSCAQVSGTQPELPPQTPDVPPPPHV